MQHMMRMRDTRKFKPLGQINTQIEIQYNIRIITENHQYKHPMIESTKKGGAQK